MDIGEYSPRLRLGEYSLMVTEPEANNSFTIIFRGEYQEVQKYGLKQKHRHSDSCVCTYVAIVLMISVHVHRL